jgi:hypothetical protein
MHTFSTMVNNEEQSPWKGIGVVLGFVAAVVITMWLRYCSRA